MTLPEFLESVRIGASFLSPDVWADSPHQTSEDLARSLRLADIWLTPKVVQGFSEADFVSLPPEERARLHEAVDRFKAIAETVAAGQPATSEQVEEALPHFLTILAIVHPYIADREAINVRRAVWRACQGRDWIMSFDYKLGEDSLGQPSVWIWLIVDRGQDVMSREFQRKKWEVQNQIRSNFSEGGIQRQLYVSVWGREEVVPMVLGGARA